MTKILVKIGIVGCIIRVGQILEIFPDQSHIKDFICRNCCGLKVVKAGHKSEGHMGMMAISHDSERLRGGHCG